MAPLTLKYRDETDRAYGLAGMSVALLVERRWDYLEQLWLDAPADQGLSFIPEFYQCDNQTLSAKALWHRSLTLYDLGMNLVLANVLTRALVRDRLSRLPGPLVNLMLQQALIEGQERCSLEGDEVRQLFTKSYDDLERVLSVPAVGRCISSLARELQQQRRLDRQQAMEHLQVLLG